MELSKKINDEQLNSVTGGTQIAYTIAAGDTLVSLAAKFHCTVEDLCRWNQIADPNTITVGKVIKVRF